MHGEIIGLDEDIVKIDCNFSFSSEVCKDSVYKCLKHCWRVYKSEVHDSEFEQSVVSDKGSFPFITFLNADVVVSPADVKLSEIPGLAQPIDDVGCKWERVAVLDGDIV